MPCSVVHPNADEIRNKWINALIVFTGKPVIRTEDWIPWILIVCAFARASLYIAVSYEPSATKKKYEKRKNKQTKL